MAVSKDEPPISFETRSDAALLRMRAELDCRTVRFLIRAQYIDPGIGLRQPVRQHLREIAHDPLGGGRATPADIVEPVALNALRAMPDRRRTTPP